jgi:hypothetical protein
MDEHGMESESDKAVRKVFAILGVDIDKPESVEAFREDLRFGRRLRKIADNSWMVFWGLVITLLTGSLGIGLLDTIRTHKPGG